MLKIKQKKGREWARLFLKSCASVGIYYLMFGLLFGLARGVDAQDGDLMLFCRVCKNYVAGDTLLMTDGRMMEYEKVDGGLVAGKVIAILSVRGFVDETSE